MSRARDEWIAKILDCANNPGQHGPEAERTCADLENRQSQGVGPRLVANRSQKELVQSQSTAGLSEADRARLLPGAMSALIDAAKQLTAIAEQLQKPRPDLLAAIDAIDAAGKPITSAVSKLVILDELSKQAEAKALPTVDPLGFPIKRQTVKQYWGLE